MKPAQQRVSGKKISAKELLSSPGFYIALLPHAFSLFLILSNNLGYFYVFSIFYLELIVDNFILSFSVLFMKEKEVKEMYKSNWPKIFLALRSFFGGLAICLFYGLFAIIFIFLRSGEISLKDIIVNNTVLLVVGVYTITKLLNLGINIFRYKTGQQLRVEDGKTFIINLVALIIFTVPGIHILVLLSVFIENIQLVAIISLFIIKAYIDSALVVSGKKVIIS